MKIWFCVEEINDEVNKNIQILRDTVELKVLYIKENVNNNNFQEVTYKKINTESLNEILYLGKQFALSYIIGRFIVEESVQSIPDFIIFNGKMMNSYYSIQNKYFLLDGLDATKIILNGCSTEVKEINYKFPYYWVYKKENECVRLANYFFKVYTPITLEIISDFVKLNNEHTNLKAIYNLSHKKNIKIENKNVLSVIIPYYNLGKYIEETLESVYKSTYKNMEVIIVDDGSDDKLSIDILHKMKMKYKKLIIYKQANQGLSLARNKGAEIAKGEFIAFLDADDLVYEEYYQKVIHILNKYEFISYAYSWVEYFDGKTEIWPTFNVEFPYLLLSNMLSAFIVIRKSDFTDYGLNRKNMNRGMEDYDSLINLLRNNCAGISIPEVLVKYRFRINSMSKSFTRSLVVENYNKIIDNQKDLYTKYGDEITKIIFANGPGYMWNNPTHEYLEVGYVNEKETVNIKYELIRVLNSSLGRKFIKIFFKLKLNKLFR